MARIFTSRLGLRCPSAGFDNQSLAFTATPDNGSTGKGKSDPAHSYRGLFPGRAEAAVSDFRRKKLDWTERFLSIALGLGSAWIDGEIVVEDASGISSFNDLQVDLKRRN
jgi:hypothetical protein